MQLALSVWFVAFSCCVQLPSCRRILLDGRVHFLLEGPASGSLKEVSNAAKGAAKDMALKTNTTSTLHQLHAQFARSVTVPVRPQQEQSNSTALPAMKANRLRRVGLHSHVGRRKMTQHKQDAGKHDMISEGKHDEEQSSLLKAQHSNVGKQDKNSKDEHDKEQANATALLERRDGNVGGVGAGSMTGKESREKRGNKEQQSALSNAMLLLPAGGSAAYWLAWVLGHWILAVAGVLVLLLCCSCCFFAQVLARQQDRIERQDAAVGSFIIDDSMWQDSEDLESVRIQNRSASFQKSTSSQVAGKIVGLSSKGKKARQKLKNTSLATTHGSFNRKQTDKDDFEV